MRRPCLRSYMSRAVRADSLGMNSTTADQDMDAAVYGFKVFDIVLIALGLCVITTIGLYCIITCCSRSRQSKRAHVYESAVTQDQVVEPVAVKAVRRSASFINPFTFLKKPEVAKDNSRICYIYSNPLPVGLKEEEEILDTLRPQQETTPPPPPPPSSIQDFACDPNSGITLDPPIFYLQL